MVRLLVAEDHAGVRAKVIDDLGIEFTEVCSVCDGQEMLDAESSVKPDIIILDISMPKVGGLEAAARLKERDSKARIIFLTMHEEPEFLQAALTVGALGYVIKARLATDLRHAVREAMAGRRFISPCLRLPPCEDGCEAECK